MNPLRTWSLDQARYVTTGLSCTILIAILTALVW